MKKTLLLLAVCMTASMFAQKQTQISSGYPITNVPFTSVHVEGGFWGQRLQASRDVTIPLAFDKCQESDRYGNFVRATMPNETNKPTQYSFDDTDVYKVIEGASYLLQTYGDKKLPAYKKLDAYMDSVINLIAAAQEPDGYLFTARTQNPTHPHNWAGATRWSKEEDLSHELYNLGHLIEGAIAHYQATGKRSLLNIAIKYADCVVREVGPNPGQACVVPGHQIPEMALAKLYLLTGNKSYLDEAKFFIDYKGKTKVKTEYSQSHKPVVDQDEAVGHAVRAGYMYSGIVDIAALTGDQAYVTAIDRIWDNITQKKYYITGGVGATGSGEAYGPNYYLPNMSAYCETCAAVAMVYFNHRMFLMHGNSKYYDVLERTLYNGVLSGISLEGGKFFYPNPLQSMGQHQRAAWFGCPCCPSNISRFIPSIAGYVYATKDANLYVNLYMGNTATIKVSGKDVTVEQQTNYPWDGDIALNVNPKGTQQFALKVRIPTWVKGEPVPNSDLYAYSDGKQLGYTVSINGEAATASITEDGYFTIERKWKKGDKVAIHFDMEVRTVKANAKVAADKGRISIERGPLVYCAEHPDNDFDVLTALASKEPTFKLSDYSINYKAEGKDYSFPVKEISTAAQVLKYDKEGLIEAPRVQLNLIPYYAWAHRGSGNMAVWIPNEISVVTPQAQPTIASEARATCSKRVGALSALSDGLLPNGDDDRSVPYMHWWPNKGTQEWVQYTFAQPRTVASCEVYWYDESPFGETQTPESWKVEYLDAAGNWVAVANPTKYGVERGILNAVRFTPVNTSALRLNIQLKQRLAAGISEWIVK